MRFLWSIILITCISNNYSQINDAFSDGDFTANPAWQGSIAQFTVNSSLQLQLNSVGSDTSYLETTNIDTLNNNEWRFYTRLAFAPSDNNYAKIYLVADQTNLKLPLNGYFIRMGENGSFDSIDLYEQSGTSETKIIDGINGHCAKTNNTLQIKVTRDSLGTWNIYADTLGGTNYLLEGSTTNLTHTTSVSFGTWCKYTTTNATKFYFDNIYAGPVIVDNTPPTLDSLKIISTTQLDVYFNEAVDLASAQNTSGYFVNNGIGVPSAAVRDAGNFQLVHLTLSTALTTGNSYTLTVSNISDLYSNNLANASLGFSYYVAQGFNIVINEIMADPDPVVGLPNAEYLELYNRTAYTINLGGWSISAGSTTKTIPTYLLKPDSFVLLCSATNAPLFTIANKIGMSSFVSLTNTGQILTLKDNTGKTISSVSYTDDWYKNTTKKNGGWSLEQIDPFNPCAGDQNWTASTNVLGGTPGKQNSVRASNPDNILPYADYAGFINIDTIQIFFSESVDSTKAASINAYSINNGIGNPLSAKPIGPEYKSVILKLSNNLQPGIIYSVSIADSIIDCVGNKFSTTLNSVRVGVPDIVAAGDIIINEILFDPNTGCSEFVELYNKSTKIVALNKLQLADFDNTLSQPIAPVTISTQNRLLFPAEYLVATTNQNLVKSCYNTPNLNGFINVSGMPSLSNSGDHICINDVSLAVIDHVGYSDKMHFSLLDDTKGVSLERIDFDRPSNDSTNWHSASSSVGYATPAYQNSQYYKGIADKEFKVEPEIFSPDNDGVNDVLTLSYLFNEPGYLLSISIYDASGHLVKQLIQNELCGESGSYSWDGINANQAKVTSGIYVIYFEAFNPNNAQKKVSKKTCVAASKLN